MSEEHIWAKEIKAWADGAVIQFRIGGGEWQDVVDPCWRTGFKDNGKYRVKPRQLKYRMALMNNNSLYFSFAMSEDSAQSLESFFSFVRWITDWVDVELNQDDY